MSLPEFFFERVSAELRQQMDGVLALAEQLARQPLAPDAKGCVSGIAAAAAGVRRTLDAALELRAVTVEGLNAQPAALGLRALTDEIAARWQARASAAGITLLASYDGPPEASVLADRQRLLQVFDGFLGEALGGAERGAVEVSVRATQTAGGLRLEGRVRGGGDAAWDAKPLEARVREIEARLGLEAALGVMLGRRIVSGLGGALLNEPGCAAFAVDLPAATEAPVEVPTEDARCAHVLVVDDNATNRVVAQALCEMLGCTSEAACDGVEAVAAARSGRFDLILMDIRMPRLDGVEATHEIRKLPGRAGAVPILALTANVDPDDANRYVAAGMHGVLEKPMKADDLRRALLQTLPQQDAAAA